MRRAKAIYSELPIARKSATLTCVWEKLTGRQRSGELPSREWGMLRAALMGGCWPGEVGGRLSRSGASCVIG